MAQMLRDQLHQRLAHQARLSGARHARHRREHAQREGGIEPVQVVEGHAGQAQPALGRARRSARRRGGTKQVTPRPRCLDPFEPRGRTAVQHLPALLARPGPDVDDPVGVTHHVQVVLDDEERVARGLQSVERRQQRRGVHRMQARRRLVQHVDDAEQVRAHLRGQPKTLQFARRQRRRAAFERQIAEPEVEQDRQARFDVLGNALRDDHLFRMVPGHLRQAGVGALGVRPQDGAPAWPAAASTSRRCRGPRTSPTAIRGRRRLPWHTGHSVLSM